MLKIFHNIRNQFFKRISELLSENRLANLGYIPRWIVFLIDICIVMFANVLTHYIVLNLTYRSYDTYSVLSRNTIIIIVYVFFFFSFKTFAGIIRHSSFVDSLKLLVATYASFCALVTLNYIHFLFIGTKIFLFPVLLIHFLISFLILILFRLTVKSVYRASIDYNTEEKVLNVVVLGKDNNAVSIANALKYQQPRKYRVVGFVDREKTKDFRRLLGLPILSYSNSIVEVLKSVNAKGIIIADKKFSRKQQMKLVDDCLDNDIKILTFDNVKNWNDEADIAKSLKNFDINDLLERKPIKLHDTAILNQISNKVILISGAAGSIGSEIVAQIIIYRPKEIILIDQAETPLYELVNSLLNTFQDIKITSYIADVKDSNFMQYVFSKHQPQIVYHAAAYKHVPLMEINPYQAVMTNVLGTKNLADVALKNKVETFVMISTDKAVNPGNIMGASKRIAELYTQSLCRNLKANNNESTKFITTRFGNVLGSNGSVVPLFTKQIKAGGPITITHPDIIRYFMTIPEACQLVLEAGSMGNGGEIFIFDMGKQVRIIDLAYKMIKLAGLVPERDIEIKTIGLRPGEKLYEELLNDSAKALPTHHEKIMIAKEIESVDYIFINENMEQLKMHVATLNVEEIVKVMKILVPEFKSLNSEFERLDN